MHARPRVIAHQRLSLSALGAHGKKSLCLPLLRPWLNEQVPAGLAARLGLFPGMPCLVTLVQVSA